MPGFNFLKIHSITIYVSYCAFFAASLAAALYLIQDKAIKNKLSGAVFGRLPSLSFLDRLNYRSIGLGFPILTISILSGFVWAKTSHGIYWEGYNSRQLYSLVLWLVYALILHVRLTARLRGRKVALLSIAAFFMMALTLFGACR
ncbi:MAG: cytochrome c biogenesis protein CcsA [Candidatus Omnitrophota bacterium]|nr:cytochrome c biogenesis protein CcsA [Candidatus Omnitrophota bacterium]